MCFGKGKSPSYQLKLNGTAIEWVQRWKYLGVTVIQGSRFGCCVTETLGKFYRALNSILRVDGRSDDLVMLRLIESHCISILSYAVEVIHIADRKLKSKMRAAYNSVFRKLFNFSWRESVTDLQHALGRPTWEELIAERRSNFLFKISLLPTNCHTRAVTS